MTTLLEGIRPTFGICEVDLVAASGAPSDATPVLIELPHGATRGEHFRAVRDQLAGAYPDDLEEFFHVNTDAGSVECARHIAAMIANPPEHLGLEKATAGRPVVVLRSLIPRTFIDCNRLVARERDADRPRQSVASPGLTPGLPPYISHPEDVATLTHMYDAYHRVASQAYSTVCGAAGTALTLHTYAPRSVQVEVDEGIVQALRRAYSEPLYSSWPRRPAVDVISQTEDGTDLAPPGLVERLRKRYAEIGVQLAENATYHLHPQAMGTVYSARYPGQVLCLEINRDLLAEPFTPFEQVPISDLKAQRMAAPIAAAWLS